MVMSIRVAVWQTFCRRSSFGLEHPHVTSADRNRQFPSTREFRGFSQRCSWGVLSSGLWRWVSGYSNTDVSKQLNVVVFKSRDVLEQNSQANQDRKFLALRDYLSFVISALFWRSFVILSVCLIQFLILLVVLWIKLLMKDSRTCHCYWSWRLLHAFALGSLMDWLYVIWTCYWHRVLGRWGQSDEGQRPRWELPSFWAVIKSIW